MTIKTWQERHNIDDKEWTSRKMDSEYMMQEIAELRTELGKLQFQNQEAVAWLLITSKDEQVCSVHKPKDDALKYWKPLCAKGEIE